MFRCNLVEGNIFLRETFGFLFFYPGKKRINPAMSPTHIMVKVRKYREIFPVLFNIFQGWTTYIIRPFLLREKRSGVEP